MCNCLTMSGMKLLIPLRVSDCVPVLDFSVSVLLLRLDVLLFLSPQLLSSTDYTFTTASNTTSDTSEPIVRRSSISKGGHVQLSYNGGSRHELHNYPAARESLLSLSCSHPASHYPQLINPSTAESETTSLADTSNSTYLEMRVRELEQRLAVIDPDVHGPPPSY